MKKRILRPTDRQFRQLFSAAKAQDREALGQLLTLYRPYLLAIANREINSKVAEKIAPSDMVQETMHRATRKFTQCHAENETAWRLWLKKILTRLLVDANRRYQETTMRKLRRERSFHDLESRQFLRYLTTKHGDSPLEQCSKREMAARVHRALGQLDEHHALVLHRSELQGKTLDEIAQELNRSPAAVRMLRLRAARKLQKILKQQFGNSS